VRERAQEWTRKLNIQLNLAHVEKLKQTSSAPNSVQVKIREGSPGGKRVTMEERICERDEF